jgi:hypothetical protein
MTLDDYERFKTINDGSVSLFDYAHAVVRGASLPSDVFLAVALMVWPNLKEVDGNVYLAEQFSELRVEELRAEGRSSRDLEFWMNLFSVDGFLAGFAGDSIEQERAFAALLASSWTMKLRHDYPGKLFNVRIIDSPEDGDVAVTFSQATV